MGFSRPRICPECGSTHVSKEYIMGSQTGDWVCGECGEVGQMNGVPIGTTLPDDEEGNNKTEN